MREHPFDLCDMPVVVVPGPVPFTTPDAFICACTLGLLSGPGFWEVGFMGH